MRPATSDQRPATSDQRPATSDQRPATSDQRPATSASLARTTDSPKINPLLKHIASLFLFLFYFIPHSVYSIAETQHFWQAGPNPFWPNTTFPALGNIPQQNGIGSNPDKYCQSLGEGWYLPSAGDYSAIYTTSKVKSATGANINPGAKVNYTNGNTASESNLIAVTGQWNTASRGRIFNEWGDSIPFSDSDAFWVSEVDNQKGERFVLVYRRGNTSNSSSTQLQTAKTTSKVACLKVIAP